MVLYYEFASFEKFQETIWFEHYQIRRCDSMVDWEGGKQS